MKFGIKVWDIYHLLKNIQALLALSLGNEKVYVIFLVFIYNHLLILNHFVFIYCKHHFLRQVFKIRGVTWFYSVVSNKIVQIEYSIGFWILEILGCGKSATSKRQWMGWFSIEMTMRLKRGPCPLTRRIHAFCTQWVGGLFNWSFISFFKYIWQNYWYYINFFFRDWQYSVKFG